MTEIPTLILHFPEELVNKDNSEDLLTQINKDIKEESDKFKSINSWIRAILRNYSLVSKQSRDKWRASKTVAINGKTERDVSLTFWDGAIKDHLESTFSGTPFSIQIGSLQLDWLIDALVWENTLQKKFIDADKVRITESVSNSCRETVLSALLSVQIIVDNEKLKREEDEIADIEAAEAEAEAEETE
jgi:hypothetical protein